MPGVLSFRNLQQRQGAAAQAPAPRIAAGTFKQSSAPLPRVKEETYAEDGDWQEEDADASWEGGAAPAKATTAKAKPSLPPAAKMLPAKRPARPPAAAKPDSWESDFERRWAQALGDAADEEEEQDEPEADDNWDKIAAMAPVEPPPKKPRTSAVSSAPQRLPKASGGMPRATPAARIQPKVAPDEDAPITPGVIMSTQISQEHPEWSTRCVVEAAKPGQPQRMTISMAEVGLEDAGVADWCDWMDRRMTAEQPVVPSSGRARFKAGMVDLSENRMGLTGVKTVCQLLEKHAVRCDVLRLTGNLFGNEGVRCVAKYLMSSSQPVVQELHLSKCAKITVEGVKWLLGCLSMHAAYPIFNAETQRYVPLWLRVENAKLKGEAALKGLAVSCNSLKCSVCLGENMGDSKCGSRQCVNVGCCDDLKHNCVAHLCTWGTSEEDESQIPTPAAHGRLFFGPAGKGARKVPPSDVEAPLRDEPRLIYEDDDVAVVLKPPGWSCPPNPPGVNAAWSKLKPIARRKQVGELMMQQSTPALQAWLLLQFGADPSCDATRDQAICDRGMVHRLDVDTSGPMLIGKTMQGFEHAKKQIGAGILKDYIVLVHGTFSTDRGDCCAPIDVSPYAQTKRVRVDVSGQPASTVWEVIAEYESQDKSETYTLVHCRMVTLKTHQIRIHMQHLGHPLVGDHLYGSGERPDFCPRMFVHKLRIGFFNMNGKACIETCSLKTVPDLWQALGRLRKVGGLAMSGCGAPGV